LILQLQQNTEKNELKRYDGLHMLLLAITSM